MNYNVAGVSGSVPVVSPFFSEVEDIEKHATRVLAVYEIALNAIKHGIEGNVPILLLGMKDVKSEL